MLGSVLSSSQLAEWIAYARLEPFGPQHETAALGNVCATVANTVAKEPYYAHDFFPSLRPQHEDGHDAELLQKENVLQYDDPDKQSEAVMEFFNKVAPKK